MNDDSTTSGRDRQHAFGCLGPLSTRQHAENVDLDAGVYGFYTEQQSKRRIKDESVRFLTDGQEEMGDRNHNAVLMWNPRGVQFPNNICPYNERFDDGFEALTGPECEVWVSISFRLSMKS